MSHFEEFQQSLAKGKQASAQSPPDAEIQQQIWEFFRQLALDFGFHAKRMRYVDLDENESLPLYPSEDLKGPIQAAVADGKKSYAAAVELILPGESPVDALVWLRFQFFPTTEGLLADFDGHSQLIPQNAKALFDHVAASLNRRLLQPLGFMPVKLGF